MAKPTIRIHNVETNEIIDREMTDQEFENHKQYLADVKLKKEARLVEAEAKAAAQAKLAALGLTVEDLTALGL